MSNRVRLVEGAGEWLLMHWVRPPGSKHQVRKLISTHTSDPAVAEALRAALEASFREAKARREAAPPRPRSRPTFTNAPRVVR